MHTLLSGPRFWMRIASLIVLFVGLAPQASGRLVTSLSSPGAGVAVSVKVLLQGPYSAGTMSTALRTAGYIPITQPFNITPWDHKGSESVSNIPETMVDWVLVELWSGDPNAPPMTVLQRRAGLLLDDGNVVDLNGVDGLQFSQVAPGNYFIVVRHRNHLAAMTSSEVDLTSGTGSYDFTTSQTKAYGQNAMAEVASGMFALFAGDANGLNGVTASDNAVWVQQNGTDGYKAGDFNLNGQITAADAALWTKNNGKGDQIPAFVFSSTFTNSIGMRFARIPAGTFLMGATAGYWFEQPVHSVTLTRDFYMGIFEVTQKQWKAITGTDPSYFPTCPGEVDDNCPVESVSWYDVIAYANALSAAEGLPACYDASGNVVDPNAGGIVYQCRGYRLPTEAEWEYATRAGTTTEYSFGEDYPPTSLGNYAWYYDNSAVNDVWSTHPVGGKLPNHWGLSDVHGNVWEWVHDWYSGTYYGSSPSTDPPGPATGSVRVLRGGGWYNDTYFLRSSHRYYNFPDNRFSYFGFRLSRTIF